MMPTYRQHAIQIIPRKCRKTQDTRRHQHKANVLPNTHPTPICATVCTFVMRTLVYATKATYVQVNPHTCCQVQTLESSTPNLWVINVKPMAKYDRDVAWDEGMPGVDSVLVGRRTFKSRFNALPTPALINAPTTK